MCRVLKVHRSGFYAWLKTPESNHAVQDRALLGEIKKSYQASYGIYGSPRIHRDLQAVGIRCSRKRVARLMRTNRLAALRGYKKKRFKYGKPAEVAANLIMRDFKTDAPNRVWVTDITYLRCLTGWLFLGAVMDLFSRKIVGWSLGKTMKTELVLEALQTALWRRSPAPGLVVHSDQGSQYSSYDWVKFLESQGHQPSMSRRGNCHDNAVKESFFSSLKMEWVRNRIYPSLEEARSHIFQFIEMFYNTTRRHSYLDYISPDQFEDLRTP